MIAISGCIDFMEALCENPEGVQENLLCGAAKVEKFVSGSGGDGENKGAGQDEKGPCDMFEGDEKDTCLRDVAKVMGDPAICDKIYSRIEHARCYIDLSVMTKNPALCEKILEESADRNYCYQNYFTFVEDVDLGTCENLKGTASGACYFSVASRTDDISPCYLVAQGQPRESCFELMIKRGDPTVCSNIENEEYRKGCVGSTYNACIMKESPDECQIKAAIGLGSCDLIDDLELQDICWAQLLAGDDFFIQ